MPPNQIAKANAELRNKSALARVSLGEGARASARFNFHSDAAREVASPLSIRTLKRRERRAPLVPYAVRSNSRVSLAPGFSRVVGVVNDGNGFNRFPRVTTTKPLKRLGCHPRLFTGLKPGANERPHEIASARIAEAKEFVN